MRIKKDSKVSTGHCHECNADLKDEYQCGECDYPICGNCDCSCKRGPYKKPDTT